MERNNSTVRSGSTRSSSSRSSRSSSSRSSSSRSSSNENMNSSNNEGYRAQPYINLGNDNEYNLIQYLKKNPKYYYSNKIPSNVVLKEGEQRKQYLAICSVIKYSAGEWNTKRTMFVNEIGRSISKRNHRALAIIELDRLRRVGCGIKRGQNRPSRSEKVGKQASLRGGTRKIKKN